MHVDGEDSAGFAVYTQSSNGGGASQMSLASGSEYIVSERSTLSMENNSSQAALAAIATMGAESQSSLASSQPSSLNAVREDRYVRACVRVERDSVVE